MAFTATPTAWIPSWAEDGTDITVPIASFPELTAAEADAVTGDIRKITFAILEQLWDVWTATATADRPTQWTMAKNASVNTATGITTTQYTCTFAIETTAQDVADEA